MFMLTQGAAQDLGFPDTCNTPAAAGAPVPIPYADISMTVTNEPTAVNVLVDCMPSVNQLSQGLLSNGDEPGCECREDDRPYERQLAEAMRAL